MSDQQQWEPFVPVKGERWPECCQWRQYLLTDGKWSDWTPSHAKGEVNCDCYPYMEFRKPATVPAVEMIPLSLAVELLMPHASQSYGLWLDNVLQWSIKLGLNGYHAPAIEELRAKVESAVREMANGRWNVILNVRRLAFTWCGERATDEKYFAATPFGRYAVERISPSRSYLIHAPGNVVPLGLVPAWSDAQKLTNDHYSQAILGEITSAAE